MAPPLQALTIRAAVDGDDWDLIGLVAACWAEYPGCVLDVHHETTWLLAPATSFATHGGGLWVAEQGGRVAASVALEPAGAGVELRALYVARGARRQGLGERLVALVEAEALQRQARFVELWSDTRFLDAHRLYERLGYVRGATRTIADLSHSVEWYFSKPLSATTANAVTECP